MILFHPTYTDLCSLPMSDSDNELPGMFLNTTNLLELYTLRGTH